MSTNPYLWERLWRAEYRRGLRRYQNPERWVAAWRVRVHLLTLHDGYNWTHRAISTRAKVPPSTVGAILNGDFERVNRETADRLLDIDPTIEFPSGDTSDRYKETMVPKVGAVRRVQALQRLGWTHDLLFEHSGIRTSVMVSAGGEHITATKHRKIAEMYRVLSKKPGPSRYARERAEARGYPGVFDWEDIDVDPEPGLLGGDDDVEEGAA